MEWRLHGLHVLCASWVLGKPGKSTTAACRCAGCRQGVQATELGRRPVAGGHTCSSAAAFRLDNTIATRHTASTTERHLPRCLPVCRPAAQPTAMTLRSSTIHQQTGAPSRAAARYRLASTLPSRLPSAASSQDGAAIGQNLASYRRSLRSGASSQDGAVASQADIRQQLANYSRSHTLPSGQQLHIQPLKPQWFHDCSEMLTDAFVDAKGESSISGHPAPAGGQMRRAAAEQEPSSLCMPAQSRQGATCRAARRARQRERFAPLLAVSSAAACSGRLPG